jgi:hypothetical protein
MATQEVPTAIPPTGSAPTWRAPALRRVAALAPFAVALAIPLLATNYFSRGVSKPPDIFGLPLGIVVEGLILGWAALGALLIWTTGSRVAATLAMAFITLPSLIALLLWPAIVLVLQNLP